MNDGPGRADTAAYFDMDGTLLRGESQLSFLLWCMRRGIVPRSRGVAVLARYAAYLTGIARDAGALRAAGFRLLRGVPEDTVEDAARECLRPYLARSLRRGAAALVDAHRSKGHRIILLTSACSAVARAVARSLPVDDVLATELTADRGVLTGERELPEPYGEGKRDIAAAYCARHGLSPERCFGYADHHSDAPFLEFVGHPACVNPKTRMQRIARVRGWPVIDLGDPET